VEDGAALLEDDDVAVIGARLSEDDVVVVLRPGTYVGTLQITGKGVETRSVD
jgi:uncharacterized NAD(P)/FAD-binding protein YdhS